ncbi:hypothetical protein C8J57DRAFT_1722539, partial [Mycena rebaudengoi]
RGVSGWGTAAGERAAAVDAPDAAHDAPGTAAPATATCPGASSAAHTAPAAYAATHATTPAPVARRPACAHDDAADAPVPPRTQQPGTGSGRRHRCRALWTWSDGVRGWGRWFRRKPRRSPRKSPRPRAARAHARPLAHARPARAGADAALRRVCEHRPAGGERVCVCVL